MGFLRSIGKFVCFFLCCKLDDDEEEESEKRFLPHPTLLRWHQNQHYSPNAERSPFLYHGMPRKDPIPIHPVRNPVPTIFISNDPSSKGKEKFKEEVMIVNNRVVVDEGRWKNVERSPLSYPRKDPIPILPVQNPVPTIFISNDPTSKWKEKLKEEVMTLKSRVVEEARLTNVQSSPLVYPMRPRKDPILPVQNPAPNIFTNNDPSSKGKEKLKEKVMTVKNTVVVDDVRWIKHYSSRHRILLVGEGDFSFSASLAVAFGSASNIIATSLNSIEFLNENYRNAASNIEKLRSRGGRVMHGIDATEMANHSLLGYLKFDRIIFNFPFAGFFKNLSRESQLWRHKTLVSLFMKNAKEMISENGEIHISHKTNDFHMEWKLGEIASLHRLVLIEAVRFHHRDYPGYNTKCGFGGDNNFNCNPSQTYKFGLINSPRC